MIRNASANLDRSLWPLETDNSATVRNWRCVGDSVELFRNHPLHSLPDGPLDEALAELGYRNSDPRFAPVVRIYSARRGARTGVAKLWQFVVSVPLMNDESHVLWLRDEVALASRLLQFEQIAAGRGLLYEQPVPTERQEVQR